MGFKSNILWVNLVPPVLGFGSNNPFSAWSDLSSPCSAYLVGQDALVYTDGSAPQAYNGEENVDSKADGGVYSNYSSNMDAGDAAWAETGGMDPGSDAYYPVPEGYPEELLTSMDEENPEEEPVLSDVV